MSKILKILSNFDLFSVQFTPAISKPDKFEYKTILGAVMSIGILSISCLYAIYILYQWASFQFLASITSEISVIDDNRVIELDRIEFNFQSNDDDGLNPLQINNTILNPILRNTNNTEHTLIQQFIDEDNNRLVPKLFMDSDSDLYITFSKCNQSLSDQFTCANQQDIDDFWNQSGNEIFILIHFSVINPKTFKKHYYEKHLTVSLEKEQCIVERLEFQASQYQLSNSLLYANFEEDYGFSDVTALTYVNSLDYCQKSYQRQYTYAVIDITMDEKLTIQTLQYPILGAILAQIGSIVSVLFMIQSVVLLLNRKYMMNEIIEQITTQYYPEVQNIKQKKTCFGRINKVSLNNKTINSQSYQQFTKNIRKKIELKLSYTNLLYEVSKMQQMILQLTNREQI